jgi:5-methylthioadenosine/S-adenosylhomocysteine deaminase
MTAATENNSYLITGGTVVSVDPAIGQLDQGDVLVRDGRIVEVAAKIDAPDVPQIDATDCIVMPGFVDTHRHTWEAPVRHLGSDWTLSQYLVGLHFGLSKHFRPEDTYAGNLLGAVEALDSGITTLLDWCHNVDTPDHADAAIAGLKDSGIRAVFAHGGGARMWQVPSDVPHDADVLRLRDQYFSSSDQLLTLAFAARGPQFAPEVTEQDWQLAREVGARITVHVGDGEWGKSRPIAWMNDRGMLGDDVTYVHCNTLADDELRLIADSGGTASVSADIETQMGHGWPATGRLLDVGIRPSLSIDVCISNGGDMFHAMKTTISTQRALDNAAEDKPGEQAGVKLSCQDVLEFATIEGARANGLDAKVGSLTPGKDADVLIVRADSLAMRPLNNPVAALVYSGHAGMVDTILVKGKVVKRNGVLTDVNARRVRELAEQTRDHLLATAASDPLISDARLGGGWMPGTVAAPGS